MEIPFPVFATVNNCVLRQLEAKSRPLNAESGERKVHICIDFLRPRGKRNLRNIETSGMCPYVYNATRAGIYLEGLVSYGAICIFLDFSLSVDLQV